ncbi:uncharacterized protein E0L32_008194 [Thyridium curvatum]|uniref:RNase MRP protein 1 RNA binding domain-containing protein n=1 Tax=Thyridium curvatum TaxID=1093900 RepID=A0A507AK56_9PEZI|nr:uncharacterized protein E0L32_008194 [Thyridium curvatum]TPX10805.1 hypothetical protein E0L32_008194 [Thyridium curvatum]
MAAAIITTLPDPPPSPSQQEEEALDRLVSALQICAGFNRRNKNQHGASKWWAQFDILRRNGRRLRDELQVLVERQARHDSSAGSALSAQKKKKRQQQQEGGAKPPSRELVKAREIVDARARWLQRECLPRTYLAFTQLAADNQYAALGLLLLGVLAQIHNALSLLLGDEQAEPGTTPLPEPASSAEAAVARSAAVGPPSASQAQTQKLPQGKVDMGIAISRNEPDPGKPVRREDKPGKGKSSIAMDSEPQQAQTTAGQGPDPEPKSSQKRALGPAGDDEKKDKKKKKKRKKGDEFGDLFSSLL